MPVRAKMKCTAKRHEGGDTSQYVVLAFQAVTDESEENKSWSKWTPSAHLSMSITNPAAFDKFEEGKEYFLDFIPVEDENAGAS